ncbi:MAG: hypothetical protein Fur0028_08440 [Bacteroidales bacterium]
MNRIKLNNVVILSGSHRKVGKTTLACKLIQDFSKKYDVVGIKLSPHFHELPDTYHSLIQNKYYSVIEDNIESNKDSFLFKKSGAIASYYIQCKHDYFGYRAFYKILKQHSGCAFVVESGGLINYVHPKLFIFLQDELFTEKMEHLLNFNPIKLNMGHLSDNNVINKLIYDYIHD